MRCYDRGVRSAVVCLLVVGAPVVAGAKPWKPHPIHVIPGVPLKPEDIKPYVPPKLVWIALKYWSEVFEH